MNTWTRKCSECGAVVETHERPPGCQCDPTDWAEPDAIPPVCASYQWSEDGCCAHCEHLEECHEKKEAP